MLGFATATLLAGSESQSAGAGGRSSARAVHYGHVFVIVEENHGFSDVIGNPAAPNLNALARRYGLATRYFAVAHPSEPNYVALLGGSTFGVRNDNPYYLNRVHRPSLVSQLDRAGISWRAYLQSLPHAGYQGICYPAYCNGTPDKDPLYVAKHNPIVNYTSSWNRRDRARQVPAEQLRSDLRRNRVPAFGLIVPDECHDQHGDPPYCVDSGTPRDPQDQRLVATGDEYLGRTVSAITHARFWSRGNNAIVIVYDEGDNAAGCCGAKAGGGRVSTVVIASHGPRRLADRTPYNHYSLLKTIERNFGLGCLAHACDAGVRRMSRLLAVTGSPARPASAVAVPALSTLTPTPLEPVSSTTETTSRAGWTVQPAPRRGAADNSFGAVSAAGPNDIWTVGNFLPDTKTSNPDATLSLAAHFDGHRWVSTSTPSPGPDFATLFGVTNAGGQAWAVGNRLAAGYGARQLVEHWDGSRWRIDPTPHPDGQRDMLFSVTAASINDVWAVGQRQDAAGRFSVLVEHYDGRRWRVVPAPNPGASGNSLYGVSTARPGSVWAVGQRSGPTGDRPLVEHYDGRRWAAVDVTGSPRTSGLLDAVVARDGAVWAAGQADDAAHRGRPLIGHLAGRRLRLATLGSIADFTNLNGVAIDARGAAWATGTAFDPRGTYDGSSGGVQQTLVLRHDRGGWHRVAAPSPGTADRVLGGLVSVGHQLLTVGYFKTADGRQPLIERHLVP